MQKVLPFFSKLLKKLMLLFIASLFVCANLFAQGLTTASIRGTVSTEEGEFLPGAQVVAVHDPSGTQYGAITREEGLYNLPNLRIGGPYTVTVSFIGFTKQSKVDIFLRLGQDLRLDFVLATEVIELPGTEVTAAQDVVLNSDRTGAATYINPEQVTQMPSVKRSTRDLIRLDPRSDGNYSFGGRNWLYNNISVDGSYFNNSFGLDDPAVGGQTAAEPIPFDAIEQVQVSVVPFDVREGSFTGAGVNTVTKSGTNDFKASIYTFVRNESFIGNQVSGQDVISNPDLSFNQSGFTVSGPIAKDKVFFFINAEIERRDDPGTNFVADRDGVIRFGESRVQTSVLDQIRERMRDVYNYDTGPYEGYIHETNNDKVIFKLDWNINENNNLVFRYNFLDAERDLPPHPFVLSAFGSGRGPNENSLPFQNSGYQINNELHSVAVEFSSRSSTYANRFYFSYNRFRDFRNPFSEDFPTIEIAENGITYTTVGHEPFSIHNILDQDVLQFTNNLSFFRGKHVITLGANFETFSFFNSFNIFRHGIFFLPDFLDFLGATTFSSLEDFLRRTDPTEPDFYQFRNNIDIFSAPGVFKGEEIDVGQLGVYLQDEHHVSENFNLTYGLRIDFPIYFTDPVDNPFSRGLTALDENDEPERVDQSDLPSSKPNKALWSPRIGFNWDVKGDRSTQLRGGTGIFSGRVPFVWIGNVISNPGNNPNLFPNISLETAQADHKTSDDSILQTAFDLNAFAQDFNWPQVWTTNIAIDQKLPHEMVGTLEFIYGKDLNGIFMRNADLGRPVRNLPIDGRPYFGGLVPDFSGNGVFELNPDGNAGIYVIDSTDEGYNVSFTAQLRKNFQYGLSTSIAYTFTEAKSLLKSTEIASVLYAENPVQGDPNKPKLSNSEFGNRHRFVGGATYSKRWSDRLATHFGLFFEAAEGNRFAGQGGNRYSFTYSGDVNGDGAVGNDLIYIPRNQDEINLETFTDASGVTHTAAEQWRDLNAFINQDDYLSAHRGEIAERFGAVNPWFTNFDLRILQDFNLNFGGQPHTFQVSLDVLNLGNLINSDWGVRKEANAAATSPLEVVTDVFGNPVFTDAGDPIFHFTGPSTTYVDSPGEFSRWRAQLGVKYLFN